MGYRYLETDVHATRDGGLVAFHDTRLDRVTDAHGRDRRAAVCRGARGADRRHRADPAARRPARGVPRRPHQHRHQGRRRLGPTVAHDLRHDAIDRVCVGSFSERRLRAARRALGPRARDRRRAGGRRPRCASRPRSSPGCCTHPSPVLQIPAEHVVRGSHASTLVTPALVTARPRAREARARVVHRGRRGRRDAPPARPRRRRHRLRPHRHPRRRARRARRTVAPRESGGISWGRQERTRHASRRPSRRRPRCGGPFGPAYRLITVALVALITHHRVRGDGHLDGHAQRGPRPRRGPLLRPRVLGACSPRSCSASSSPGSGWTAPARCRRCSPARSCWPAAPACAPWPGRWRPSCSAVPLTGLGAGLIVVTCYVLVGRAYPDAIRPRVFSMLSAAWVLPSLVGAPDRGLADLDLVVAVGLLASSSPRSRHHRGRRRPARARSPAVTAGVGHASRDHRAHVRAAWAGCAHCRCGRGSPVRDPRAGGAVVRQGGGGPGSDSSA